MRKPVLHASTSKAISARMEKKAAAFLCYCTGPTLDGLGLGVWGGSKQLMGLTNSNVTQKACGGRAPGHFSEH